MHVPEPASSDDPGAARRYLSPLVTALERSATRHPDRYAICGDDGQLRAGELAEALRTAPGPSPPRRLVMRADSTVDDARRLLIDSARGDSVLLLDGQSTSREVDRARAVFLADGDDAADEHVLGLCTSGTNGLPKVVALDWDSALRNAQSLGAAAGYGPDDVLWATTPLPHLYGLGAGVLAGLLHGARVVLSSGLMGPSDFTERLISEQVTVLLSVPFLLRRYLRELASDPQLARGTRLRATLAAGEPVSEELVTRWMQTTSSPLLAHYGLTEGGHLTLAGGGRGEGAGRPLADVELRVDDSGEIVMRRRPPARAHRIIGTPAAAGGWLATGDLGHIDAAGNVHLTGRRGDRISVASKKVDPVEVEDALRACAGVRDCAVVGGPAGDDGEHVVAFVAAGAAVLDSELRAHMATVLSPYKLPRLLIRIDEIPRTLTGKVRRGHLVASLGADLPGRA